MQNTALVRALETVNFQVFHYKTNASSTIQASTSNIRNHFCSRCFYADVVRLYPDRYTRGQPQGNLARDLRNFGRSESITLTIAFECTCCRFQAIKHHPPSGLFSVWTCNLCISVRLAVFLLRFVYLGVLPRPLTPPARARAPI